MPYSRVLRAFGLPAAQLLLLSALAPSSGLGSPVFPQSCDCGELFTFVVETVEANYPGYQDLIQSGAGSWLEGRTVELERKARAVETADCAVVLHEWVRLFGDLHLSVRANDQFTWSDRVPTTGGGALRIKILDDESILLRVPSFAVSQRQAIDSLLSEHWSSITQRRSLIIDLRRNPGGTDASFRELLPLVYTDPITVGLGALWASPANVALWKSFVTNPAQIQQMEEGLGGFVTFEPSLITYDETLAMPERVAILVYCC